MYESFTFLEKSAGGGTSRAGEARERWESRVGSAAQKKVQAALPRDGIGLFQSHSLSKARVTELSHILFNFPDSLIISVITVCWKKNV